MKQTLPPLPLKNELHLHWLAVNGSQPLIPENPSSLILNSEDLPTALPKEMQVILCRIENFNENSGMSTIAIVFSRGGHSLVSGRNVVYFARDARSISRSFNRLWTAAAVTLLFSLLLRSDQGQQSTPSIIAFHYSVRSQLL